MKKLILLFLLIPTFIFSQDDLLGDLEAISEPEDQVVTSAFKALKIVNFESTKLAAQGDLYFVVSHRFGTVKNGLKDFFGLDVGTIRLNFIYGISDKINIGVSRNKQNKFYDLSLKYKLLSQKKNGFPFNVVGYSQLGVNTALDKEANLLPKLEFANRLTYTNQLLISRKMNKKLSLELMPTIFHENFVANDDQENTQYALGIGGRHKLSSRVSINIDYGIHFNRASSSNTRDPLSIGFDFETGGHVFQLHFTNSTAMYESGFMHADGDWGDGNFFFGFNLNRVF